VGRPARRRREEGHQDIGVWLQARYAKKHTDAVKNRILMDFENRLSDGLRVCAAGAAAPSLNPREAQS
jgi:hypothetical protein